MLLLAVIINTTTTTNIENSKYDEAKTAGNDAGKESKESTESWTGWAKDKITEGLGLKTQEAKDTTIDSVKSGKDKVSKIADRFDVNHKSNGLSLARTSSSTLAGALAMKRDPRCSHEALRN